LARKGIKDDEGCILAQMLVDNKSLRKLELEGNLLGTKSITEFGKALRGPNKTLRLLDLEGN